MSSSNISNRVSSGGTSRQQAQAQQESWVDRFDLLDTLGKGSYGKVKLAIDKRTGSKVAIKFISKANIKKAVHTQRIKREIRFLKLLHHPNIVRLFVADESASDIILAMELAPGGELFNYIVAQGRLKEPLARRLYRQIISAVDYCHKNCVIHRDLKPENLLLDADMNIKIIDFGFANMFDPTPQSVMATFCGSPFYASPEMVLGKKYTGPEVDVWSLGVILFALLCGHLPFDEQNTTKLFSKICAGKFEIPSYLSKESADLINKMIKVNPLERYTLDKVKEHPWINEGYDGPPQNFIPQRPEKLTEPLDKRVLVKLPSYGIDLGRDQNRLYDTAINPVLATYHLIHERLIREEEEVRRRTLEEQKKRADANKAASPRTEVQQEDTSQAGDPRKRRAVSMTVKDTASLQAAAMQAVARARQIQAVAAPALPVIVAPTVAADQAANTPMITVESPVSANVEPVEDSESGTAEGADTHLLPQKQPKRRFRSMDSTQTSALTSIAAAAVAKVKNRQQTQQPAGAPQQELTPGTPQYDPELRSITGAGVFNTKTSSAKPPGEILKLVEQTLRQEVIQFVLHKYTFHCATGGNFGEIATTSQFPQAAGGSATPRSPNPTNDNDDKQLEFEIEICLIEKVGLFGLYFHRIRGNPWAFKSMCENLMEKFKL